MANFGYDLTLVPAGTVSTATGTSTAVELDNRVQFRGQSVVTAVAGTATPTITVTIETSFDNGVTDAWRAVGSYTAQTTTAALARKCFPGLDRWVRASWVISGTNPSITWGLSGEAV